MGCFKTETQVDSEEVLLMHVHVCCSILNVCFSLFRSTVQMLKSLLDPEGVKRRKGHRVTRRVYQNRVRFSLKCNIDLQLQGPNFVWHLDGYDKKNLTDLLSTLASMG